MFRWGGAALRLGGAELCSCGTALYLGVFRWDSPVFRWDSAVFRWGGAVFRWGSTLLCLPS